MHANVSEPIKPGVVDDKRPRWIRASILAGSYFFIFALLLSAVFDPRIRLLHLLQALIYVAVILLTRRSNAWGYGAGFTIALFWNYTNLFVTTFIRAGLEQIWIALRTGHLQRPDLVISVVAALGHFLLIAACLIGFVRIRPGARRWLGFVAAGVLAVSYFIAIIYMTGPQYIPLVHKIFHT